MLLKHCWQLARAGTCETASVTLFGCSSVLIIMDSKAPKHALNNPAHASQCSGHERLVYHNCVG